MFSLREDAETFAYGDSFNDLEMLEYVKHGVCMENGNPKLLSRVPLHAGHIAKASGIFKAVLLQNIIGLCEIIYIHSEPVAGIPFYIRNPFD